MGSWCSDRNSSRRRIPICFRKASLMDRARLGDTPRSRVSFSGSSSMTRRASSPNSSMSRRAVAFPTPFTAPEAR